MFLQLLYHYIIWFVVSVFICIIGYAVSLGYSKELAIDFVQSYILHFNGLLVCTSGFGLLTYALSTHKSIYHNLVHSVLEIPKENQNRAYAALHALMDFKNKQSIAIPIYLIGASLLLCCGYPLYGAPRIYLWFFSSIMFYAGGLMLAYLHFTIRLFREIEKLEEKVQLKANTHLLELENFNLYLSVLFLGAMIALYFSFRGTLTANFIFQPPYFVERVLSYVTNGSINYILLKKLLIYPIIVFLPISLFAGFYIKYVLRKVYLNSIKQKLNEIDALSLAFPSKGLKSEEEIEKTLQIRIATIDLKNKIIENNKVLPMIDIKDSPSMLLLAIILIQFIYQNDSTIQEFISLVIGLKK